MFYVIHFTHNFPLHMKILQFTLECKFYILLGQCHILLTKDELYVYHQLMATCISRNMLQ